jgi:hypothetical protein
LTIGDCGLTIGTALGRGGVAVAELDEETEGEPQAQPDGLLRRALRDRGLWTGVWAGLGAVALGVTLPTLLVCWNCGRLGVTRFTDDYGVPYEPTCSQILDRCVGLEVIATVACGPGALILTAFLYANLKRGAGEAETRLREVVERGMFLGACLAFLNLPAYGCVALLPETSRLLPETSRFLLGLKVMALFAVAGASAGAWIGWQAWRATHTKEPFWPRYSLLTLIVVVVAWGALMGLFAPK